MGNIKLPKNSVDFLSKIGMKNIENYEKDLLEYATLKLLKIKNVENICDWYIFRT